MALIAFLIALDTGSPIFFVQERTGMGGKRFRMYKFRTMVPDAERMLDQVAETNVKGELAGPIKLKDDPRVTRVGRILRRTSLDELPQVFNVLRGEMSLVGPRPTSWSLASYQLWQTERLNVRPGITGLWQVCDRGDTSFDEWLRWDIKYIERMSLWLDLQIILRTVGNVLARRGAH
jgi:lipopolysaccharide/colanic/teichoic acid biosynthesis glycosyltransferase